MIDCKKCPEKGVCCGPVPFDKEFVEKHRNQFQTKPDKEVIAGDSMVILVNDLRCIFFNRETKSCSIYEDRPGICRVYGTTIAREYMIACPYFKPNGNPWSEAKRRQIDRIHERQTNELFKRYS